MAARPWVISVLSTDYDLHDYRKAIIMQLHDSGVMVSAFELPDFAVEPYIHSHDSCIRALDRVDIALLIIDKRYGGIYGSDPDSPHSITEAEYLAMVESGKPCFVFVSKQTYEERHLYKTQLREWTNKHSYTPEQEQAGLPKNEFDAQYRCTYVDSIQTIDFVEKIQKAYQEFSTSNWIDQYVSIPDLLSKVEGKLKGHSRFMLECLVREQKKKLENRHTSTGLSLSLCDVFSRGYYLEPSYEKESGNLQNGASLDEMIRNTLLDGSSVLVYGEAGYGKTTILAKSYLSHVERFLKQESYSIPFYLWLKRKTCEYHFNFSTYINESFIDDWNREAYPYMDLSNIRPYFYFDGFDEIAEKMTSEDVEKISQADIFSSPILLTCRQQYAFRYIDNFKFSDRFGIRLRVNKWDANMAKSYIDNFCRINGKSAEFAAMVHQLLTDNHALRDILNSPLYITMLLWIVERNRMCIPETIRTRVELFKACVNELAKRELTRLEQSETFASNLVVIWSYAAWEIYYNKLKNTVSKLSILIPKLKTLLTAMPFDYSASHFEALFDSSGDEIFGTFHEQFLEFLVANTIHIACCSATYPFPEFLSYVMRPEINRYFRAIWRECLANEQRQIVTNLHNQYLDNLGDDSFIAVSKRVHAMYHIGRFDTPERQEWINKAFNSETHISVLLSLFFGAIKMGRLDDEQKFFELLTKDMNYNEANRGYHIAYYSDAIMGASLPFQDNTQKKWTGTLKAFLRHFNSGDVEHYFLRRIDLVTMKHLVEARNEVEPLSKDIIDELKRLIYSSPFGGTYPEFQSKIESAFVDLKEIFERMQTSVTT
jgi:hypothetical protein